jgi:hypothetical protein
MKRKRRNRSSWYSEKNTTTAPCSWNPEMECIYRCGVLIAIVPKNKEA